MINHALTSKEEKLLKRKPEKLLDLRDLESLNKWGLGLIRALRARR